MRFQRLPRFRLGTLFLLTACLACYLAGHQNGWRARDESALVNTKSYDVADLLPAPHDPQYWAQFRSLTYFLEESINSATAFYDMSLPATVKYNHHGSISASLPPHRVTDVDVLLAKLRELKQVALTKGEPFEIPAPLRNRTWW